MSEPITYDEAKKAAELLKAYLEGNHIEEFTDIEKYKRNEREYMLWLALVGWTE